jgi:hypothetical protein
MDYHRNEVAVCPVDDKDIQFLVCLKERGNPDAKIHLWEIRGPAIRRVKDYSLIGWEEGIYKRDIQRHFQAPFHTLNAMTLGVHLMSLAKATSNNIGGDITIVTVTPASGMRARSKEEVKELENRVALFDSLLDALRLQLSDTSITIDDYDATLTEFHVIASEAHQSLIAQALERKFVGGKLDLSLLEDPYSKLPSFEDSLRSMQTGAEQLKAARLSRKDLAETSLTLSNLIGAIVQMVKILYEQKVITIDDKDPLADSLLKASTGGRRIVDSLAEQRSNNVETISAADASEIYKLYSVEVLTPALEVLERLGVLLEKADPLAIPVLNALRAALVLICDMNFTRTVNTGFSEQT